MEDFLRVLFHASKSFSISFPEQILFKIKSCGEHLNLTCCSLTEEMCKAIGRALSADHYFTSVSFGDCMLPEEGLLSILKGLYENTKVKNLDLKGNNIRSAGAECIAKLICHNSVIENLILEWNLLGLLPEMFQTIANSLAVNATLKKLDLRNNQISPDGTKFLFLALCNNSTLVEIDLRWNSCGLIGGREILRCLQVNRNLVSVHLAGTGIPLEILLSIERAIKLNVEHKILKNEYSQQMSKMEEKLKELDDHNFSQVKNMTVQPDEIVDKSTISPKRLHSLRVKQLRDALIERKTAIVSLTSKVESLKLSMQLVEQKNRDLSEVLSKLQVEKQDMHEAFHKLLTAEREEFAAKESHFLSEKNSLREVIVKLEKEINHYKKELSMREKDVLNVEESLHSHEKTFNEKLKSLQEKNGSKIAEMEERKKREVKLLEETAQSMTFEMNLRLKKVEDDKLHLQEEVSRLSRSIFVEKSQTEAMLSQQRQQLQNEEAKKISCLEEQLQAAYELRQKHEVQVGQLLEKIKELQMKNSQLDLQQQDLKCTLDSVQQELNGKEEEMKLAVVKSRLEVKFQLEELAILKETNSMLNSRIEERESKIVELEKKMEMESRDGSRELEEMRCQLREERRKMQLLQEDEARRASGLQEAFVSYLSGLRKTSTS